MCHFLTVGVPARRAEQLTAPAGSELQLHPTANPSVLAAFPDGFTAIVVTEGFCSCNIYARPGDEFADAGVLDRSLRRKAAKLGWSAAKIRRAARQSQSAHDRRPRPTPGLRGDVIDWLHELCGRTGHIAVVVHFYSVGVESEAFECTRLPACRLDDFPRAATELSEDAVLVVRHEPGRR